MPDQAGFKFEEATPEYESFATYAELVVQKRELETLLNEIESKLKTLEPQLLTCFAEGIFEPPIHVRGLAISPHREPWVYPRLGVTRGMVCQALKAGGLAQYVTENFNTRSLTKYVRDLEIEYQIPESDLAGVLEHLPAELANVIEVKPTYRIQTRRR